MLSLLPMGGNVISGSDALLLATILLLLAGCGRGDQFGDKTTPQPAEPTQDAALAPALVAPQATAEMIYPAPKAAYPAPDAAAAVATNSVPDKAYPAPPTAPAVPTDDQGFVNLASGEIGLIIDTRNNMVVEVVPNSPAEAAGIQVGGVITQVEDKSVGNSFKDAKKMMGDKLNKQVKIEILCQGKKRKLSIKASTLILPTDVPNQPTPTPILDPYTYL